MKDSIKVNLPGDLDLRLEREIDRNRRYEARRPDRHHWCRRLGKAEGEVNALVAGVTVPPGLRGFVLVRKLAPGPRVRGFFFGPPGLDVDLSEAEAAALWDRIYPDRRDG